MAPLKPLWSLFSHVPSNWAGWPVTAEGPQIIFNCRPSNVILFILHLFTCVCLVNTEILPPTGLDLPLGGGWTPCLGLVFRRILLTWSRPSRGHWTWSPTINLVNIYKYLEPDTNKEEETLLWRLCCALLWSMKSWKVCILDQALRRSQVEFIDPSNRRVFGEAAALLWCLDQPLHTAFGPLLSGGGCKVSVVRREGFVPAAIPWSTAPHFHLPFFSWI